MRSRRAIVAVLALCALSAAPAAAVDGPFEPVPIGAGPEYVPPARWPLAGAAAFGGLRGDLHSGVRAHLELFANRQVVIVPGGIGVSGGRTALYGIVTDALWHAPAWTLQPGGVIQLARPGLRLGDFFAVWGEAVGPRRLLGFTGEVRAFVNGVERFGNPARIELHDRDQVVLEIGGYVPPHRSFTFTPSRK
jgi:hypothetical protein